MHRFLVVNMIAGSIKCPGKRAETEGAEAMTLLLGENRIRRQRAKTPFNFSIGAAEANF